MKSTQILKNNKKMKLTLEKTTLRILADKELVEARGGGYTDSVCSFCNGQCTDVT